MEWDFIRDSMIWILGAIFSLIQLIQGVKTKKSITMIILLSCSFLLFIGLGLNQIYSNKQEKVGVNNQFESLNSKFKDLQKQKSMDSSARVKENAEKIKFESTLFENFGIKRDTLKNIPIKYNINFEKVRDVFIGDHK